MGEFIVKALQYIIAIVCAIAAFFTSRCSLVPENDRISIRQDELFCSKAEEVYEAFKAEDADELEELFCDAVRQGGSGTDTQTEAAFSMIDGNIVSYKRISGASASESVRGGETVRLNGCPTIEEVETDTGRKYRIAVSIVLIYNEDESREGVNEITIYELEGDEINVDSACTIGEEFEY